MAQGLFNLKQINPALRQGAWATGVKPTEVNYLVVAGGGGAVRGGGGGGGLLTGTVPVLSGSAITVTVGAGGTGRVINGTTPGGSGGASVFGSVSATGGGGGGTDQNVVPYIAGNAGQAGGSGGGGGATGTAGFVFGGQGVFVQGSAGGGNAGFNSAPYSSGGGGGAGTLGCNALAASVSGNGGSGISSVISGTVTAYAGGGGGANYDSSSGSAGSGGVGGGGNGVTSGNGTAGTANTGGGGGGANAGGTGGSGGSGIVIVSYPDVYAAPTATTGSPTVSTSGSGSTYFNGSSYFSYNGQSTFAFGTGDFTIECWFYAASFGTTPILYDSRPSGGNGAYITIYFDATGAPQLYVNTATAISGSSLSVNTWYHVAVSRSGTATKMFINGSQTGSTYTDTTNYTNGTARPTIAANGSSPGSNSVNGYISNLRIIKGTALYTTTFTPPTAPLTAVTNTQLLLNSVSGAYLADGSTNSYAPTSSTGPALWNALSPFTVTGYKNRVYTWTSSGSITF